MKSIKKFIFIMAALAATLAFVSCSNGNGDDSGRPSVVATYTADDHDSILTFFADNTFTVSYDIMGKETIEMAGTYTGGNPSKNGQITITITKTLDFYTGNLIDLSPEEQEKCEIKISSGTLYFDYYEESFTRQ